jgi:hypothetical protein
MTRADCHAERVRRLTPMTRAASSGRKYKRGSGAAVSLSPIVVSPFLQQARESFADSNRVAVLECRYDGTGHRIAKREILGTRPPSR